MASCISVKNKEIVVVLSKIEQMTTAVILTLFVPQHLVRFVTVFHVCCRRNARGVPDLGVQLDVFDEQRESDEAQILHAPHGVDLNSHLDVFYAILRQVSTTNVLNIK